jgi:hypothetical protein
VAVPLAESAAGHGSGRAGCQRAVKAGRPAGDWRAGRSITRLPLAVTAIAVAVPLDVSMTGVTAYGPAPAGHGSGPDSAGTGRRERTMFAGHGLRRERGRGAGRTCPPGRCRALAAASPVSGSVPSMKA